MRNIYQVVVGNIGTMNYTSKRNALDCYNDYVAQSIDNYGRAANEDVTLFKNGEIQSEHFGIPVMGTFDENGD